MEDELKRLSAQVEQLQSENIYLKRLLDEAGIPYTRQKEIAPIVITKQLARRFYSYFWGRTDVYSKRSVNKSTGKSIPLSAYFKNSDYKDVISKEITRQMKEEMKKDTNKVYWCQKNDNPRFKGISKNQSYYINKQGELVICFDQFEVAPGYMGNPTFTIKNDLLDDYFK